MKKHLICFKMNRMKKNIIKTILTVTIIYSGFTQQNDIRNFNTLTSSIPQTDRNVLLEDQIVFRYGTERKGLYYIPDVLLAEKIYDRFIALDPDVTVEALFTIPYPEDLPDGYDRDMIFYNILREVSNISGVQYYSRTKKKHRVLFDDVYAIDDKKNAVEDPVVLSIPVYDSIPIHMDEANLGEDYYLAEYHYDGLDIAFSLTNTSNMKYIFKVVGEKNMQIDLLFMPLKNELLVYGYCGVKLSNPGFVNRIMNPYSSFFRRLYAMEIWFSNTLMNEDKKPEPSLLESGRL